MSGTASTMETIRIVHRHDPSHVIYEAQNVGSVREAVEQAVTNRISLKHADLAETDLTGADLSGADLTSARLDGARWTDGTRICGTASFGQCR